MKKSITYFLLFLAFNTSLLYGQAPGLQWAKVFGTGSLNDAFSIQQTKDGGYIVAGQTSVGYGRDQFLVIKTDGSGNIVWQQSFGGSNSQSANSVQQTSDGGYIVAGESNSVDGVVTGNHGGFDYWIVKLDASGNLIWQKSLGGSQADLAMSIQQTTDGGYIIGGESQSNDGDVSGNHGNYDDWIVKLDANGNLQWQKSYGGSNLDVIYSIRQTKDGGYIAAGLSASQNGNVTGVHDITYGDFWIIKLDNQGNLKWQKALGGSDYDLANCVRQTTDGGYIVAGFSRSANGNVTGNHGDYDAWVVKLDSNGNLIWQNSYGGSSADFAYSIEQTPDGGYVFAGGTASNDAQVSGMHGGEDFWVVKIDGSGNLQWQVPLGGSSYEEARSINQTSDGGYVVAGYTNSTDGNVTGHTNSNYVCWVTKLSAGGSGGGGGTCNCVAPSGGISTGSITSSGATLQWGTISCMVGYQVQYKTSTAGTWTTVNVTSNTGTKILSGLRSSTNYQWKVASQCSSNPNTYSAFSSVQTFKTLSRNRTLSALSVAEAANTETEEIHSIRATIWPNPASGILKLNIETEETSTMVRVINITGQVIMEKNIYAANGNNNQLDISKLLPGLYCVYIRSGNNYVCRKFLKQ